MAEIPIESFFQIKDPYLKLHDKELYLSQKEKFKKDPRFQDVILRQLANDPYYHKNDFNLSQTYHHIDYILHPSDEPFVRPEITETYIAENPQGTKTFYPSFLPGKYIDVKKVEREFDELLLRKSNPTPSELEILKSLFQSCTEEEEAICSLQNEIQVRLGSLQETNIDDVGSFKNYFRNLCDWMITGTLKENMNENVLADEKGFLLQSDKAYNYQNIVGLNEIHQAIINLHTQTRESLDLAIKKLDDEMTTEKNKNVREARKSLEEELQREKLMEEMRKRIIEEEYNLRLLREKKLKDAKEKAFVYQEMIGKVYNNTKTSILDDLKNTNITVGSDLVNWSDIVGKQTPIENDIKTNFINTLEYNFAAINTYKQKLFELNIYLDTKIKEQKQNINHALWAADELKSVFEFRDEDELNIESIERFNTGLDDMLDRLIQKRKEVTTYNLAIEWYKKTKAGITGLVSDRPIDIWANGEVLYRKELLKDSEILLSYRVYDDDGNLVKLIKVSPLQDMTKLDIYSYIVKDSRGKEKPVEFGIRPLRRGANQRVQIKFTIKDIVTA